MDVVGRERGHAGVLGPEPSQTLLEAGWAVGGGSGKDEHALVIARRRAFGKRIGADTIDSMREWPPLDADRLVVFLAVVRERGFSAAARALGRSQPAVSQAIAALERELGQPLIARTSGGAAPTHAGRILVAHAERALGELSHARAQIAALGTLGTGALSIGTTDTLACHFLPPVLTTFRRRHPRIELRIETKPSPQIAARVAARELDLGIVTRPLPTQVGRDATVERVASHRDVAIVVPSSPLGRRRRIALADLAKQKLLLLDRSTAMRASLDEAFARARLAPEVVMETSSVEVLKRLAALGFGVAIVPEVAVEAEVARGELAAIALAFEVAREIVLMSSEPRAPAAEAFAKLVRAQAVR
jgi:DNA-binding transcriptional LysR family regulator